MIRARIGYSLWRNSILLVLPSDNSRWWAADTSVEKERHVLRKNDPKGEKSTLMGAYISNLLRNFVKITLRQFSFETLWIVGEQPTIMQWIPDTDKRFEKQLASRFEEDWDF